MSAKVRLVRCPGCRQLLVELPELLLYKCGECGKALQAKTWKKETNLTQLSSQPTNAEEKEPTSSNHDLSGPPQGEPLPDEDNHWNLSCHDDHENSPIEVQDEESKWPLAQNRARHEGKFHDCDGKWIGSRKFSDESIPGASDSEHVKRYGKSNLDQYIRVDHFEGGESTKAQNEDQKNDLPSGSGRRREGKRNKYVSHENEERSRIFSADQNGSSCGEIRNTGVDSSSPWIVSHKYRNVSQIAKPSIEVGDAVQGLTAFRRSSTEKNWSASVEDSSVASPSAAKSSLVPVNIRSPDDEHLVLPMRKVGQNFGSTSSTDILGNSHPCDGDQIRERIPHPSRRKSKDVDHISKVMLRKDGYRVNDMLNSEPETNYRAPSSSAALKASQWNHYEFTETKRHSGRAGNGMSCGSRLPFIHRTGSPVHKHNLFPPHPGFHSPDKPSYSESDKMDLFRTVCELKDQLNRIQFPRVAANGKFPAGVMDEKWAPYCSQGKGCTEQCNVPRLTFPGEAAYSRCQLSCSCLHCCRQDWHCSAQFPSHSTHHKNGYHVVETGRNHCNISGSSTPQHNMRSELSLWGCETKPENQRHRDHEMKRLLREKYHTAKRHLRPMAGGAPVVLCYHCSELLQLPANFLIYKKRYYQLWCGGCRKVLKFSLLKSKHIVPFLGDASAPLPSEAGNYTDATNHRNPVPISRSNSCQHIKPFPSNGDYGRSFSRSCTKEREAQIMRPSVDQILRNTYNRKISSRSSCDPTEDRRMKSILKETQNKNKGLLETFKSVGPAVMAKVKRASSEIKKLPPLPQSSTSPANR